jgi:hypothetical protein
MSPDAALQDVRALLADLPPGQPCIFMTSAPPYGEKAVRLRQKAQDNIEARLRPAGGQCSFVPGFTPRRFRENQGNAANFRRNASGKVKDPYHPTEAAARRFLPCSGGACAGRSDTSWAAAAPAFRADHDSREAAERTCNAGPRRRAKGRHATGKDSDVQNDRLALAFTAAMIGSALAGDQYVDKTGFAVSGYDVVSYFDLPQSKVGQPQQSPAAGRQHHRRLQRRDLCLRDRGEPRPFLADPAAFCPAI